MQTFNLYVVVFVTRFALDPLSRLMFNVSTKRLIDYLRCLNLSITPMLIFCNSSCIALMLASIFSMQSLLHPVIPRYYKGGPNQDLSYLFLCCI